MGHEVRQQRHEVRHDRQALRRQDQLEGDRLATIELTGRSASSIASLAGQVCAAVEIRHPERQLGSPDFTTWKGRHRYSPA